MISLFWFVIIQPPTYAGSQFSLTSQNTKQIGLKCQNQVVRSCSFHPFNPISCLIAGRIERQIFEVGLIWTWQAYYYSSIIEDLLCLSRAWLMRLADNVQHISVNNYIWLFTQKHFKVCLHLVAQTCFSLWLFSHFETLISHSTLSLKLALSLSCLLRPKQRIV